MSGNNRLMQALAKETVIYGLSSIIGKFLNWLLVPLYTFVLAQQSDYGIVTNLYAWTALLLVILTYGMETGFFRFANKEGYDSSSVYKTAFYCLLFTSTLFALLTTVFRQPIANALGYADHADFIAMMGITVALDAFASIPFAYLRKEKRPILFAALKLLFVVLNIAFNLLFLVVLGWKDVKWVFVANISATVIQTLILLPFTFPKQGYFQATTLRAMLRYSLPLLVLGIAGIMNQTIDRIIFPFLYTGVDAQTQLGIYGACFKVAMVMMMFTQAFRYAYEPFVFARNKDKQSVESYAEAMKYYIIFSYLILIFMLVFMDLIKYIIAPNYWEGLKVVPIVLWTYIFQGVYFNLSFWYKLTDRTQWGAWLSLIGLVITVGIQVLLVPRYGYMASAISSTICYFVIMLISYALGKKYLPIPYDMKRIGIYTLMAIGMFGIWYVGKYILIWGTPLLMGVGCIMMIAYCVLFYKLDFYVFRNRGKDGASSAH